MKKINLVGLLTLILIAVIAVLSSCSTKKKLTKSETETHTVLTQTVTESLDTLVSLHGSTLIGIKAIDEILAGDSIFEETPELKIITKVDHGKLKTVAVKKDIEVHVTIDKKTVSNLVQDKKEVVKTKMVEKKALNLNYFWWLLVLVLIPVWKYRKRIFS